MRHVIMLMKPYSKEALTSTKMELAASPNVGMSILSEISIMSLIEYKDEITGITRDGLEDATMSASEESYPKIELTKMEKDGKIRCGHLDGEANIISEASHPNENLLAHQCQAVEAKEVQNEGTMREMIQKEKFIKDIDHETKNIPSMSRHDTSPHVTLKELKLGVHLQLMENEKKLEVRKEERA